MGWKFSRFIFEKFKDCDEGVFMHLRERNVAGLKAESLFYFFKTKRFCLACEFNVHQRNCVDLLKEPCPGKSKKVSQLITILHPE